MPVECKYHILVGPIPEGMFRLPENKSFIPIKDEIRKVVWQPENMVFPNDKKPRVSLLHRLAWFALEDYDYAFVTYEILQGHFWESQRVTLDVWVLQQDGQGDPFQIHGPIDSMTGQIRKAPVPLSPPIVPVTHRRGGSLTHTRPQSASLRHGNASPNNSGSRRHNSQLSPAAAAASAVAGSIDPCIRAPTNLTTSNVGIGYPNPQQIVQSSPGIPMMMPAFSISSRNSSISTLSAMMMAPDAASLIGTQTLHTTSSTLGTPYGSRTHSHSNLSVASNTPRSSGPFLTPPLSVSEYGSEPPSPAAVQGYKVTIRNLSHEATRERLYALIEENTHAFVQMIQPEYITLRQVHGQLHAYVKFIQEEDARKAVQQLHGYKFMGRMLQASLR